MELEACRKWRFLCCFDTRLCTVTGGLVTISVSFCMGNLRNYYVGLCNISTHVCMRSSASCESGMKVISWSTNKKVYGSSALRARTKKRRTQKSHKSSSPKGRLNVWRGSMKLPQNGAKLFNIAFDCHILRWAWGALSKAEKFGCERRWKTWNKCKRFVATLLLSEDDRSRK